MKPLSIILIAIAGVSASAQQPEHPTKAAPSALATRPPALPPAIDHTRDPGYVLGPGDQVTVLITDAENNSDRPLLVDMTGHIRLPLVGRIQVSGMTVPQVEDKLVQALKTYFKQPDVSVAIAEYGSQPVSVIGEVKNPGVQQVRGRKTLVEMLALAGGLTETAGSTVNITRRSDYGPIPLSTSISDPSNHFSVAEVLLKPLISGKTPDLNIPVHPYDVLSIPKADTVYVIGQVIKSGGFLLNEHEHISVLQALSMAGGLDRMAKPQEARILRLEPGSSVRTEIAINLRDLLESKTPDVPMKPEDILFVPDNIPKRAFVRTLEATLQMATGVVIWRK